MMNIRKILWPFLKGKEEEDDEEKRKEFRNLLS